MVKSLASLEIKGETNEVTDVVELRKFSFDSLVSFDLERSFGSEDSEIIEIGYSSKVLGGGCSFIILRGMICSIASRNSHHLVFDKRKNTLVRGKKEMKCDTLLEAAKKVLEYLEKVRTISGALSILVCHGQDITTLVNNFALVGLDKNLIDSIGGVINFIDVVSDDVRLASSYKSLTKLREGGLNISQTVLGDDFKKFDLKKAHDALFDAELLLGVIEAYLQPPWSVKFEALVDVYLVPSKNLINHVQTCISILRRKRERKVKKLDENLYHFYGWEG